MSSTNRYRVRSGRTSSAEEDADPTGRGPGVFPGFPEVAPFELVSVPAIRSVIPASSFASSHTTPPLAATVPILRARVKNLPLCEPDGRDVATDAGCFRNTHPMKRGPSAVDARPKCPPKLTPIDHEGFPHIIDAILEASSFGTLLAFRATNRSFRRRLARLLSRPTLEEERVDCPSPPGALVYRDIGPILRAITLRCSNGHVLGKWTSDSSWIKNANLELCADDVPLQLVEIGIQYHHALHMENTFVDVHGPTDVATVLHRSFKFKMLTYFTPDKNCRATVIHHTLTPPNFDVWHCFCGDETSTLFPIHVPFVGANRYVLDFRSCLEKDPEVEPRNGSLFHSLVGPIEGVHNHSPNTRVIIAALDEVDKDWIGPGNLIRWPRFRFGITLRRDRTGLRSHFFDHVVRTVDGPQFQRLQGTPPSAGCNELSPPEFWFRGHPDLVPFDRKNLEAESGRRGPFGWGRFGIPL